MKTLSMTATLFALLTSVSAASAGEQAHYWTGILMEKSDFASKVAKDVPPAYAEHAALIALSAEVHGIAKNFQHASPKAAADVALMFDKLKAMKAANEALLDIAAQKDDHANVWRAIQMRRLIGRMFMLTERLEWSIR